ncbi:hypothetical protein FOWG_17959 [Fusarium oxysporum f. sp. lycopersici MN25]|nr:hypothetical protein FOWG_18071 [Fusarium oxysporum f. sp. lycopersici MN25]EWZ77653.1 hypothetical protein FOWG_17959 [Fusarium oxysporum f. sp. lycopersici MN25]
MNKNSTISLARKMRQPTKTEREFLQLIHLT